MDDVSQAELDELDKMFDQLKNHTGDLSEFLPDNGMSGMVGALASEAASGTQGYLLIQLYGKWQKRYFSLQERQLSYFRDIKAIEPEGSFDFASITGIEPIPEKENHFQIKNNDQVVLLQASTQEEMRDWIQHLQEKLNKLAAVKGKDTSFVMVKGSSKHTVVVKRSLYEEKKGTLDELTGKLMRSWKPRNVVMIGGFLFVHPKKGKKHKYPLYHCTLELYQPESNNGCAFRVTTTDDRVTREVILRASEETEMHKWLNTLSLQRAEIENEIDHITY